MYDSDLKMQLDSIVNDLAKINGVDGSLIIDGNGEVLSHNILHNADIELFGPMANVITSSSKRLINFMNQGEIERVLVESKYGKALFLHLGNVHFIVLMKTKANVGMVMISSKKAAQNIVELTRDLTPIELEEKVESPVEKLTEITLEATKTSDKSKKTSATLLEESKPVKESSSMSLKHLSSIEIENPVENVDLRGIVESEILSEDLGISKEEKSTIPIIKPPIAFPQLEKVNEVPENELERSELILIIYESIFKAMSIGASKIMGVAPARGLTRKFLPIEDCKKLLNGVDVKNNSTIDFHKIRENIEKIPVSDRETSLIDNFTKIIGIITENYGKVMGYAAFRGMVRPEFKIINESYGIVMDELKIKDKLHPELQDLF